VEQPKGFKNPHHTDLECKLKKALYGFKQAPRALYKRITTYLVSHGSTRGIVDSTLFIRKKGKYMLLS
jgi:hypothetical protein